ncbi:MAG TPA: SRPBCC family protein [Solirubrobacteraceae bacterium]|nr:SRPBCC family protein [Solirubrobacteraceae bacterium]
MTETTIAVRHALTVKAPVDRAFAVFTQRLGAWWPLEPYSIGEAKAVDAALEPREGGRWYEIGEDGSECDWGHVRTFDPPHRVVLSWEISADWQPDPTATSEVEVRFTEVEGGTRVELEHRGLETYGARTDEMRGIFGSEHGWNGLLRAFAAGVEQA